MQFTSDGERYEFVAANLKQIESVVWAYYRRTGRFAVTDIEENTQAFVVHLMTVPKVLDRYDEAYSLGAYLNTVFKFWYADQVKKDPYRIRRSKADITILTDVIAEENEKKTVCDRISREEIEDDEMIYSRIRELENVILDLTMDFIEADLDEHYACLFGLVRFDRSNLSLSKKLGLPMSSIKNQRVILEKYIRRLRINGVKLGEYFWEAVAEIRLGGEPAPIEMTVSGIETDDPEERKAQIWEKVTSHRKSSGNYNYGQLEPNECTSADIKRILVAYLPGRQNPHHRLTEWVKQGKLRIVRTNGKKNSYRRVIYAKDSVLALKAELDSEAQRQRDALNFGKMPIAEQIATAELRRKLGESVSTIPRPAVPRPNEPLLE